MVEDISYRAIQELAFTTTEGLNEAELRARLDLIRQLLLDRERARNILADYLAGNRGSDSVMGALEELARQTGFYDQGDDG